MVAVFNFTGHAEGVHAYDALTAAELIRRGSLKWSAYPPDVLPAWVAEMDFPPAPAVQAAVRDAVDRADYGYPPSDVDTGLPAATAARLAAAGLRVPAEWIRLLPDILHGITLALTLHSPPGTPVVVPTPAYPPFFDAVRGSGRSVVEVPMRGRAFDLAAIDAALAAGAGTLMVCNPHNPLGTAFSAAELAGLAEVVAGRGARVVADEVHWPLVFGPSRYVPYASVSPAAAAHSVTLVSASKGWNLPGLRCAQAVPANAADAAIWAELTDPRIVGPSTIGIAANLAAYTAGDSWLADALSYVDVNRRLLADLLAEQLPRIGYRVPDATYLAWLDCRPLGLDDPAGFFLDKARVALADGRRFGTPGYVRLNLATPTPILREIVGRMAQCGV